jgi:hypothetical protein
VFIVGQFDSILFCSRSFEHEPPDEVAYGFHAPVIRVSLVQNLLDFICIRLLVDEALAISEWDLRALGAAIEVRGVASFVIFSFSFGLARHSFFLLFCFFPLSH